MSSSDEYLEQAATTRQERSPAPPVRGIRVDVLTGPGGPATSSFTKQTITIGRSAGADMVLADREVSAYHLDVSYADGGVLVRDLGSLNGVFYERARIHSAVLTPGAIIGIGQSTVRLDLDAELPESEGDSASFGALHGQSAAMRSLFAALDRLAKTELTVLLEGPTGTGKELAARALHDASARASGPFVVLDCTAIPPTLAESVLFGHEKGAFTGATDRQIGAFEAASGGTLFIDEVGELEPALQPKLLRALERREIVRLGSNKPIAVDVRIVSATLRDVRTMINVGRFREDLYYRLAHARMVLPPLSERREDIPLLVKRFLKDIPPDTTAARAIAPEALEELSMRDYPGNIRELRSTVNQVAMLANGNVITRADLTFGRLISGHGRARAVPVVAVPAESDDDDAPISKFKGAKRTVVEEFERKYLERLMARTGGNLTRAAQLAGIERHYLRDLTRKYGLRDENKP